MFRRLIQLPLWLQLLATSWTHASEQAFVDAELLLGQAAGASGEVNSAWSEAFFAPTSEPELLITARLREEYKNQSVTITSSLSSVFAYAALPEHTLSLHPRSDSVLVHHFSPAAKRGQDGSTVSSLKYAAIDAVWSGQAMVLYHAEWTQGFDFVDRWWIVRDSDTASISDPVALALIQAVDAWNVQLRSEIWSFQSPGLWVKDKALWSSVQHANWDAVILNETVKEGIREDVEGFFRKEKAYQSLGVPWKRGSVFLGPAGNGKTITIKALMKTLDVPPLYVRTLKRFGSDLEGIKEIFRQARTQAPCLLVIEDIDSLINDGNRSPFLNEVDGLENNDGIYIIATTNHVDRLDGALANRPSRFDRKFAFDNPNEAERLAYAEFWRTKLAQRPNLHFDRRLAQRFSQWTDGFSFAYLQEAFLATLLGKAGGDHTPFPVALERQVAALRKEIKQHAMEELVSAVDVSLDSGSMNAAGVGAAVQVVFD